MNMQLREADWALKVPAEVPPRVFSARRRYGVAIIAGLLAILAIGGEAFWLWYTTRCGDCGGPVIVCAKRCLKPIVRDQVEIERLKAHDRLIPDPAPQTR